MDESITPQQTTIDLNAPENLVEYKLTLTVGQIKLLRLLIEKNLQPKGYEMIKLTMDLFERLQVPEVSPELDVPTGEAFQ